MPLVLQADRTDAGIGGDTLIPVDGRAALGTRDDGVFREPGKHRLIPPDAGMKRLPGAIPVEGATIEWPKPEIGFVETAADRTGRHRRLGGRDFATIHAQQPNAAQHGRSVVEMCGWVHAETSGKRISRTMSFSG